MSDATIHAVYLPSSRFDSIITAKESTVIALESDFFGQERIVELLVSIVSTFRLR